MKLRGMVWRVALCCVMSLAILCCLSELRLTALLVLLPVLFLVRRFWSHSCLVACRQVIRGHVRLCLAVMVLVSWIVRMAYVFSLEEGLSSVQLADAANYWQWAGEFANGMFPDVKCWTAPAGYALVRLLIGDSLVAAVILNGILQTLTALVLYLFGRRAFGFGSGMLAAAVYLFAPTFVVTCAMTIAEHFFFLFVSLAFLTLARWDERLGFGWAVALPFLIWLAIWTRGEGVLLFGVVCVWAMCRFVEGPHCRRRLLAGLALFVVLAAFCGTLGYVANMRCHGTRTAFCSNDNYWPRLHGSDLSTHGRVTGKRYIKNLYLADHPGDPGGIIANMKPQTCPKELIPYIEREISRRWSAMSFWTKVRFVFEKERYAWAQSFVGNGRPEVPRTLPGWIRGIFLELIPTAVCLWVLARIGHLMRFQTLEKMGVRLAPICFVLGMVAVLVVYESNVRYGMMAMVFLPFYVGSRKGG